MPQLVDLPPGYISYGGSFNPQMKREDHPIPPQPKQEYLAFFHGVVHMAQHLVMTYVLGAYTFTAEPPFKVTAMSAWPIVSPDWMESFTYKHTDVVVFPMTFEHDALHINLTYGWDESDGYILTLDKKVLFDSLRPTNSRSLGSADLGTWSKEHRPDPATFEYSVDWNKDCEKVLGETNCANFRRDRRRRGLRGGGEGQAAIEDLQMDEALRQRFGGA